MEEKEKAKVYIVCKKTLKELEQLAKGSNGWRTTFYIHTINRGDLSDEQLKVQQRNNWYSKEDYEVRLWNGKIEEIIKKSMHNKIISGEKENIKQKMLDEIMNMEIRCTGRFFSEDNNTRLQLSAEMGEEDRNDNCIYIDDAKEFEYKTIDCGRRTSFSPDLGVVLLEEVSFEIHTNSFSNLTEKVDKMINKVIRNDYTYCIKNGNVIIPDEYISKGEKGIEEWRDIKKSKNKNNSIEKKLLRDVVKDKKNYAYDCVYIAMDKILYKTNNNYDWTIPRLVIDGKYNKQRTAKLAMKILGTKDKQKIIDMPKETILENAKKYWKEILMDAYNNVDKMEVPDGR